MFTLDGDFGKILFSGSVDSAGSTTGRYMSLDLEGNLNFFKKLTILKSNILNNSYGLFSFMQAGRNNKVKFASLTTPKHLLSSRKSGCSWNPKGKVQMGVTEFSLNPVEYNGEQCPDVFYGDCLEKIFGTGNQIRDFFATQEGRTLLGALLERIYYGLGNSFYDLVWNGQRDLITSADANDWYTVDDREWADFKDQQSAAGGILTMVDWFKNDGLENANVEIKASDISADGTEYVGLATDLFDRLLKAETTEQKMASKRSIGNGLKSVILASPSIFLKYERELISEWGNIPAMLQYFYTGKFCAEAGCLADIPIEGALKYKGHLVICMDEWDAFNELVGVKEFRAMTVAPGNFGIGYDVPSLQQFAGLGMRLNQKLEAPHQGMIYMDTAFDIGTGIIDEKFFTNASKILVPNV